MKKGSSHRKTSILGIATAFIMTLTACGNGISAPSSTFPSIEAAKIPDALEITVGTLGDCYFSDGITDNPGYKSVLTATFNDTTETDYSTLIEHYKSTATGADEDGFLLFDWGRLQVTKDDGSISVTALIQ